MLKEAVVDEKLLQKIRSSEAVKKESMQIFCWRESDGDRLLKRKRWKRLLLEVVGRGCCRKWLKKVVVVGGC